MDHFDPASAGSAPSAAGSAAHAARIFDFNRERGEIVREVAGRVWGRKVLAGERNPDAALEYVLNDVAFHEIQRLEPDRSDKAKARRGAWQDLARSLGRMSTPEKESRVRALIDEYAQDIVGNFDPRVYQFATRVLPLGLAALLTPQDLRHGLTGFGELGDHITVQGDLETLRALAARATLVFTPTHMSNLDSILIGFALLRAGLPPATYGAGKNLFTNRFISFFMQNLGAYKVDRRLRFALYKDVLKEYSSVLLERGFHSLFFPGGTRSRAGEVEHHLKLGLLGTALAAYVENLRAARPNPDVFIVPVTLNYPLVLEAATLIEDHFKAEGKGRYIIEDDEFSRFERIVTFLRRLLSMEQSIVVHFSHALDPFGNRVGPDGRSRDRRGRPVDRTTYVARWDAIAAAAAGGAPAGAFQHDRARDAEYTEELGRRICEVFAADTVAMSTHVTSLCVFELLRRRFPSLDLYRLLRAAGGETLPLEEVTAAVGRVQGALRALADAGRVRMSVTVASRGPAGVLDRALRYFSAYHVPSVLTREGARLRVGDTALVVYYRNRLMRYGLERAAAAAEAGT
ncbi:MAG TPA: 1-acyl-sn-glycerol-3-phosphate acyltransferase [Myxococcota bacterium]|jgi:glycerol-3-phosphate O-acyltransferase|nr:1-acyl-sn-glycerol-3-phosphate acyltransferase [Myxococcota bacterium]